MNSKIGNNVELATQLLISGGLVAIPTETVYALAANALNEDAVLSIFKAKKRPLFDPLILHVPSIKAALNYCEELPNKAIEIANQFSPGPITFLLPRKNNVPDLITSGLPKVAIRIPDHPLTLQLLQQLNFPLAAPSANPFGYISPTSAMHVHQQLGDVVDYILDGGDCKVGIESTIIEFEQNKIIVHRLGGLSIEQLEFFGEVELRLNQSANPSAPGKLKSHYAPRKQLIIGDIDELIKKHSNKKTAILSFQKSYAENNLVLSPSGDLTEASKNLFSFLRKLDEGNADLILTEKLPDTFLGKAINDRLKRASAIENEE
jgi:L-threonylcarbamoyladenylate synthase